MAATCLDDILEIRGVTKAQLARTMDVSPQYIGQINKQLANGKPLSPATAEKIANALHIELGELEGALPIKTDRRSSILLNRMQGVEVAYLKAAMEAVREARRLLLVKSPPDAVRPARGKPDTRYIDLIPEYAIVERLREFDDRCAVFTEECTVPDHREFADQLCYFIDPLDRSRPLADYLSQSKHTSVAEALDDPDCPLCGLSAPFASVSCIRNSRICFNVMLDYQSGQVYVACKAMLKHGLIEECADPEGLAIFGEDIRFEPREGLKYVTFLGHKDSQKRQQYEQHLSDLAFPHKELPPDDLQTPGGPARILYLSEDEDLIAKPRPAFIMSNGEKICEWLGWLAYIIYSEELMAYEIYAEKFTSRDSILLAPPPNYSLFSLTDEGCTLNLDRIATLDRPVLYRSAMVVMHKRSAEIAVEMRGIRERCRELRLD